MTFGDFLYFVGFQVEYTAVRLARRVWAAAQWAAWAALTLLAVLLRPVVRAAANFKAALCAPRQLADYLLPVLACAALAVYLHTALSQPFVLRVEVNGQSVGYVAGEAAFEAARADVQARINGVADWQIQPEYTLVRGGADKSYGIQVAKLAGVPDSVISRAREIAGELSENDITARAKEIAQANANVTQHRAVPKPDEVDLQQLTFFDTVKDDDIIKELDGLELSTMTPLDALNTLYRLQTKLKNRWKE